MSEQSNISYEQKQDDEISLIDLFAVLVRYRKLIVIGTFVVTFVAGLYLFIIPVLFPSLSKQTMQVEYTIQVNELSPDLAKQVFNSSSDVKTIAKNSIMNMSNFAVAYKNHPAFLSDTEKLPEGYKYNSYIRDLLQKGNFDAEVSNSDSSIQITVKVKEENLDVATSLVNALVSQTNKDLENFIMPRLKADMDVLKNSVEKTQQLGSSFDSDILQEQLKQLIQISNFIDTYSAFCVVSGEPFIVPDAQGRLLKLLICCFAAFFVFVFAAFAKNAVANVKADPQASKTISDAWKAGK